MAYSKCGFCKSTSFELIEHTPNYSRFKMYFVQCGSCGHPVGVVPYANTESVIIDSKKELESRINNVAGSLDSLYTNQQRIMNELKKLKK